MRCVTLLVCAALVSQLLTLACLAQGGQQFYFALPPTTKSTYTPYTTHDPDALHHFGKPDGTGGGSVDDKSPFFVVVTTTSTDQIYFRLQYKHDAVWHDYNYDNNTTFDAASGRFAVNAAGPALIPVMPFLQVPKPGGGTMQRWMQLPTGANYKTPGGWANHWTNNTTVQPATTGSLGDIVLDHQQQVISETLVASGNEAGVFRVMVESAAQCEVVVFSAYGWSSGGTTNIDGTTHNEAMRILPVQSLVKEYRVPTDTPARYPAGQYEGLPGRGNEAWHHIVVTPVADAKFWVVDRSNNLMPQRLHDTPRLVKQGETLHVITRDLATTYDSGTGAELQSDLSGIRIRSYNATTDDSVLNDLNLPANGPEFSVTVLEEAVDAGTADYVPLPVQSPGFVHLLPPAWHSPSDSFTYVIPPSANLPRESSNQARFEFRGSGYDARFLIADGVTEVTSTIDIGTDDLSLYPNVPRHTVNALGFPATYSPWSDSSDYNDCGEALPGTPGVYTTTVGAYVDYISSDGWLVKNKDNSYGGLLAGDPPLPNLVAPQATEHCPTETIDRQTNTYAYYYHRIAKVHSNAPTIAFARAASVTSQDAIDVDMSTPASRNTPFPSTYARHSVSIPEQSQWVNNATFTFPGLFGNKYDSRPGTPSAPPEPKAAGIGSVLIVISKKEDVPNITIGRAGAATFRSLADTAGWGQPDELDPATNLRLRYNSVTYLSNTTLTQHLAYAANPNVGDLNGLPDGTVVATFIQVEYAAPYTPRSVEAVELRGARDPITDNLATFAAYGCHYTTDGGFGYSAGIASPPTSPTQLALLDSIVTNDDGVDGASFVDAESIVFVDSSGVSTPVTLGSGLLPAGLQSLSLGSTADSDSTANTVRQLEATLNPQLLLLTQGESTTLTYEMILDDATAAELREVGEATALEEKVDGTTIDRREWGSAYAEFRGTLADIDLVMTPAGLTACPEPTPCTFQIPEEAIGRMTVSTGSALERQSLSGEDFDAPTTTFSQTTREDINGVSGPGNPMRLAFDENNTTEFASTGSIRVLLDAGRPIRWDELTIDLVTALDELGDSYPLDAPASPGNAVTVAVRPLLAPPTDSDESGWSTTPVVVDAGDPEAATSLLAGIAQTRYLQIELVLDRFEYDGKRYSPLVSRVSAEGVPSAMTLDFEVIAGSSLDATADTASSLLRHEISITANDLGDPHTAVLNFDRSVHTADLAPGPYFGRAVLRDDVTEEEYGRDTDDFIVQTENAGQSLARDIVAEPGPYVPADRYVQVLSDVENTSNASHWNGLIIDLVYEYFNDVSGEWILLDEPAHSYMIDRLSPRNRDREEHSFPLSAGTPHGSYRVVQNVYLSGMELLEPSEVAQFTVSELADVDGVLSVDPGIVDLGQGGSHEPVDLIATNVTNTGNTELTGFSLRFRISHLPDGGAPQFLTDILLTGSDLPVGSQMTVSRPYALPAGAQTGEYEVVLAARADQLIGDSGQQQDWLELDRAWFSVFSPPVSDRFLAVELPPATGNVASAALGINRRGDVVGRTGANASSGSGDDSAVLWPAYRQFPVLLHDTVTLDSQLGVWSILQDPNHVTLDDAAEFRSIAVDINDQRFVAGNVESLSSDPDNPVGLSRAIGFLGDISTDGIWTLLPDDAVAGDPGTYGHSRVNATNSLGAFSTVVGEVVTGSAGEFTEAVMWPNVPAAPTDSILGNAWVPDNPFEAAEFDGSTLAGVNSKGDAVGWTQNVPEADGGPPNLTSPLGLISGVWDRMHVPTGISRFEFLSLNDDGDILAALESPVGLQTWVLDSVGLSNPVPWNFIPSLDAGTNHAAAMNTYPTIVGWYETAGTHRGAVTRGVQKFEDATSLVFNTGFGWDIGRLHDVNDEGVIVGEGQKLTDPTAGDNVRREAAVVLDPLSIPEALLPDITLWLRADVGAAAAGGLEGILTRWTPANDFSPNANAGNQTLIGKVFLASENCCERPYISFASEDSVDTQTTDPARLEQSLVSALGDSFTLSTVIRPRLVDTDYAAQPLLALTDGTTPVFTLQLADGVLEFVWQDGSTDRIASLGLILESDEALLTFVHSGAGSPTPDLLKAYRDGHLVFETETSLGSFGIDGVWLQAPEGANDGESALDIAELLLFGDDLGSDSLDRVDQYMVKRYGLDIDRALRDSTLYVRADRGRVFTDGNQTHVASWVNIGNGWSDLSTETNSEPGLSEPSIFGCRPGLRFDNERIGSVPTDYILIMDRSRSMFRFGYPDVCLFDESITFRANRDNRGMFQVNDGNCIGNVFAVNDGTPSNAPPFAHHYWTRAGAAVDAIMNLTDLTLGPANSGYTDVRLGLAYFGADPKASGVSEDWEQGDPGFTIDSHTFPSTPAFPATRFLSPTPGISEVEPDSSVARMLAALHENDIENSSSPGTNSRYKWGLLRALNSIDPSRRTEVVFLGHGLPRTSRDAPGAGQHQTVEQLLKELDHEDAPFTELNPLIPGDVTYPSILACARDLGVRIHTLGFALDMIAPDEREGAEQILRTLAERTGGEYYPAFTLPEISASFTELLADDVTTPYESTKHLVLQADKPTGNDPSLPQLIWFSGNDRLGTSAWIDHSDVSLRDEGRAVLHVEYWNRPTSNDSLDESNWVGQSGEIDLDRPIHLLVSVASAGTGTGRRLRAIVNGTPLAVSAEASSDATILSERVGVGPFDLGGTSRDLVMGRASVSGSMSGTDFQGFVGYIGEVALLPRVLSIDEQDDVFRHVDRDYEIIIPVKLAPIARARYRTGNAQAQNVTVLGRLPGLQPGEPQQTEFVGDDSTDPNVEQIPELDYAWFVNGQFFQSGQRVTVSDGTFEAGTHEATLRVTDPDGLVDTDTVEFTILGTPGGVFVPGFGSTVQARGSVQPVIVDGKLGNGATVASLPMFDLAAHLPEPPQASFPRTIAFWANPDELSSSLQVMFQQNGESDDELLEIAMNSDVLRVRIGERVFGVDDSGLGGFGPGWHHIAFVVPEHSVWSDEVRLYINGVHRSLITLGGTGLAAPLDTGDVAFGLGDGSVPASSAALDEFLFAAVPFSHADILQLAARSSVFHWRFNEGVGASITDSAGGGDPVSGTCQPDGWNSGVATASGVSLSLDVPVTATEQVDMPLGNRSWTMVVRFEAPDAPRVLVSDGSGPIITAHEGTVTVRLDDGGDASFSLPAVDQHWHELIVSSLAEPGQILCWTSADTVSTAPGTASIDDALTVGAESDTSWSGTRVGAIDTFALIGAPVTEPDDVLLEVLRIIASDQY